MLKLLQSVLILLSGFLTDKRAKPTGIAFIYPTKLQVCHNLRIPRHHVFDGVAKRGHGRMVWFYRFKLHLIINDEGDILAVKVTRAHVDDRSPVNDMCEGLWAHFTVIKDIFRKNDTMN